MQTLSNRIRALMKQHDLLTEKELSIRTGVPQPTINRILTGATKVPRKAALKALSAFFKVPLHALLDPASLGHEALTEPGTKVPLLVWTNIRADTFSMDQTCVSHQYIISFKKLEGQLFALMLEHDILEPKFSSGTILIFRFDKIAKNRDYVLINIDGEPMLKQFLMDGKDKYIKSLSSDLNYPITKYEETQQIFGVLVQSISEFGG